MTSLGPAGRSIATSLEQSFFAALTYAFPGPNILFTLGTIVVPYAIARIACAPPTLYISFTPYTFAIHNISGDISPDLLGGVQTIMFLQPAT